MLVDGTVYSGSKWRHIPGSNRSCPNRVARRSTVTVFLSSQTPRARPRRCRLRLSLRVVDNPGDHSRRTRALTERQQAHALTCASNIEPLPAAGRRTCRPFTVWRLRGPFVMASLIAWIALASSSSVSSAG
jgi:hypothetical protein